MKDQVDALVSKGVKAANLDSTLTADRAAWVKQEVLSGQMKVRIKYEYLLAWR